MTPPACDRCGLEMYVWFTETVPWTLSKKFTTFICKHCGRYTDELGA